MRSWWAGGGRRQRGRACSGRRAEAGRRAPSPRREGMGWCDGRECGWGAAGQGWQRPAAQDAGPGRKGVLPLITKRSGASAGHARSGQKRDGGGDVHSTIGRADADGRRGRRLMSVETQRAARRASSGAGAGGLSRGRRGRASDRATDKLRGPEAECAPSND